MSVLKKIALTAALGFASAGAALAADLPARGPAPAPAPVFIAAGWTGFYAGLNVGYGCCGDDRVQGIQVLPVLAVATTPYANLRPKGVFGGVQIGYNWQRNNLVYGIEADAQLSGMKDSFSVNPIPGFANPSTGNSNIQWFGTLRGRLGWLVTPNTLFYGTGGLAVGSIKYNVSIFSAGFLPPAVSMGGSYTQLGWTAGLGLEHKFNRNWSVKAEYLYVHFMDKNFTAPVIPLNGQSFRSIATPSVHTFKVGLNYHFVTGGGAVVAKY